MPQYTQPGGFRIFATLACIYAALIFYLSSLSNPPIVAIPYPSLIPQIIDTIVKHGFSVTVWFVEYLSHNIDKIEHIILYFGFGTLLYLTFTNSGSTGIRKHAILFAMILGIICGTADEIHQSFVPGRTTSIADALANCIGVVLAQVILVSPLNNFHKNIKK